MRISVSLLKSSNANVTSKVGEEEQIRSEWRWMQVRRKQVEKGKWEEKGSYSWEKSEKTQICEW